MIPSKFDYHAPTSLDQAYELLDGHGDDAKILTGGHSLTPALKLRLAAPAVVIDLRKVPGLRSISTYSEGVRIGALVVHRALENSALIAERCPLLGETAAQIGDVQVRNVGTLVGSICHADPAADYPAALLALDAEVVIGSSQGSRTVAFQDFLQGLFATDLEPNEIVQEVCIPRSYPPTVSYQKMKQSASGFALAGVAVQLTVEGSAIRGASVGVTGAAEYAFRADSVERRLLGASGEDEGALRAAAKGIVEGRELLSDIHATAEFRAHLAEVLAARAVLAAAARA